MPSTTYAHTYTHLGTRFVDRRVDLMLTSTNGFSIERKIHTRQNKIHTPKSCIRRRTD